MGLFTGKVAIVIGASTAGGMGEATAKRLAGEGAKVVVSARSRDYLETLASQIDGSAFAADITSESQIKALVNHTVDTYGALHLAVNHAGVADRAPVREIDEEHLIKMTRINYFGTVWFIKSVAEKIVDGGAIVTTSTMSAHDAHPGIAAYASAKRAADRFVQAAAVEYRDKRLRINSIIPSANDTHMLRKGIEEFGYDFDEFIQAYIDLTPLGRVSIPEDIAAMTCMLLRDDYFETGQLLHCSGGNSLLGHPRAIA